MKLKNLLKWLLHLKEDLLIKVMLIQKIVGELTTKHWILVLIISIKTTSNKKQHNELILFIRGKIEINLIQQQHLIC